MKMKKFIAICSIVGMLTAALAGCGSDSADSKDSSTSGSTSEWDSSNDITVVSREDGSGTRGAFIELFGVQEEVDGDKVDMTTEGAQITNSTSVMLTTVAGDEYAIGYVSLGSLDETVKAVKIDGAEATAENIKSGTYKVSRPFNIATKEGADNEVAEDFINFIMSEEGQKVVVLGSVSVYERDGKYQIYAKEIILEGAGLLYQRFEQLKVELEEMGLFDPMYKKPIPRYATRIGICTAQTGAAIQDIINITTRRNPYVQLYLYPCLVQGADAAKDIVNGIRCLDSMNLDTIIVGRGGGSIEDLWAFNTEQVARAVFECETPIISAVGHETDYTICDFVSDLRAPTPSAAAELAVPDSATLIDYFDGIKNRLLSYLHNKIDKEYQLLDNLLINTPLENMNDFINLKYDDLAVLQTRLVDAYSYFIEQKNNVSS